MTDDPKPPRIERRISSPEHRAAFAEAQASPLAHKPRLITSRSVQPSVHGSGAIGRFNTWLAVVVTKSVGTMWAAYVFTVISLIGAVALVTNNPFLILLIALISQTFLQLVLLPIIIVGQNVISASQDARAEQDHLTLTTLHAINVQQLKMLEQQREMLNKQREILDLMEKTELSKQA